VFIGRMDAEPETSLVVSRDRAVSLIRASDYEYSGIRPLEVSSFIFFMILSTELTWVIQFSIQIYRDDNSTWCQAILVYRLKFIGT